MRALTHRGRRHTYLGLVIAYVNRVLRSAVLPGLTVARVAITPVTVLGEIDAGSELGRPLGAGASRPWLSTGLVNVVDVTATTVRHYARMYSFTGSVRAEIA